jgi:hypothetical protein
MLKVKGGKKMNKIKINDAKFPEYFFKDWVVSVFNSPINAG